MANKYSQVAQQLVQKAKNEGRVQSAEEFYSRMPDEFIGRSQNTSIPMPRAPEDQVRDPEDYWGKPPGWDYQTAKLDWKGNPLPAGAKGFKPDGTVWWGGENTWQEWKASFMAKINAPAEKSGTTYWEDAKQGFKAGGLGGIFSGVVNAFNALGNYKMQAGETPTGLAKGSRAIGQALMGLGAGLGSFAEWTEENVVSRVQGWEDIAEAGNVGGDLFSDKKQEQAISKIEKGIGQWGTGKDWFDSDKLATNIGDSMRFLANLSDIIVPFQVATNGIRALIAPLSAEEKRDIMAERVNSSKVLYSTWIEPAIKADYLARVNQGEHPYLVALDMQKPIAELAGQAVLDPLNLIGMISKGTKAVNSISSFQDYMGKPLETVRDFFKINKSTGLAQLDDASDITMLAEKMIEARKASVNLLDNMSTGLNVKGQGPLGFIRPKINRTLEKAGVFAWTASGKRHHLQRLVSDMTQTIIQTVGKDPDEALDIVKYMVQMQSDDIYEVAEAIGHLAGTKMPMNMLTSEGGMRFGAVMREMMLDADGVVDGDKFIKAFSKVKDDPLKALEFFDKKIDKVAKQLFPDLSKRAEVLGKIEKGEELTKAEMLIGKQPLSGGEKFWLKVENVADNKFLTTVNGFFANVYMGLSPGYAFRNLWTNEFHLLMDMGVGEYVSSWAKFNPRVAEKNLDYLTRSSVGQMASIGVGSLGSKSKMPGTRLAGYFEKIGGQRAYGMAYKDTLNKTIPKIMDEIIPQLRQAGATDEMIDIYRNTVRSTYGRFDEAGVALREAMEAGQASVFRQMGWMPDEMVDFFDHFHVGDEIRDIIRNSEGLSMQDVQDKVRGLYTEIKNHMKTTEKQIAFPQKLEADGMDGFEHSTEILQRLEDAVDMSDEAKILSRHSQMANRTADGYYSLALKNDIRLAQDQGIDVMKVAQQIAQEQKDPKLLKVIEDVIHGRFYDGPHEDWRTLINEPIKKWLRRIEDGYKSYSTDETIRMAWRELGHLLGNAENPPKNMSIQQMKDLMWNVVHPLETRKHYAPLRDAHAIANRLIHDGLEKAGAQFDDASKSFWKEADRALLHAQAWDTAVTRNVSWDDLGRATGDMVENVSLRGQNFTDHMDLKKLGIVNGIPTGIYKDVDNRIIPTNELLNRINKILRESGRETYRTLDEVPYERGEWAIKQMKGKDFQGIWRPEVTKVEIPPGLTDVLTEARNIDPKIPTAQMDQRLGTMVKAYANQLSFELDLVLRRGDKYGIKYPDWFSHPVVGGSKRSYKGKKGGNAVWEALLDLADGKDGDAVIFENLREYISKYVIGGHGKTQSELIDPVQELLYEARNKIASYAPEPPSMIDDFMDLDADMIPKGIPGPTFEGGLPAKTVEDIQTAFNDAFEGMDLGDDFWNSSIKVPSPEWFSDPHAYLSSAPEINSQFKRLMQLIKDNHGKTQEIYSNPGLAEKMKDIDVFAGQQEVLMRATANEVGTAQRNFSLLNYDSRRNFDTMAGILMPYQFWYGRTYANWAKRIARNPAIVANYARYKEAMAQIHAGLPEFWQQNLSSAELLGLFPNNPVYFNLEQTLNPLQGLTGVDFEDPYKRVDAWSRTLDDVNRFGPTTSPIYSYALAFAYLLRGEKEASSRWGGRLIPQTNTLKALGSVLGMPGLTKEIDPAVWLFSGGVDPYERRRTGRAFSQMIMEGALTEEQALDASWSQEGQWWEMARQRAVGERAPGHLASFFLGVGFKGRNKGDIATDMMYDEFFTLMNMRDKMSPADFKQTMSDLEQKYPFMDSVLTSAKTGWARDMTFAYNVLGRIPPGDTSRLYEMVGIDKRLVNKFYESRGEMSDWAETDRKRFMAGVIDMSAVLAVPDGTTKQMWTDAKKQWSIMTDNMKRIYGPEIENKIDQFYALKNAGKDGEAEIFLSSNPEVDQAMQYKLSQIVNDPTGSLQPYYSSMQKIASYEKQVMWDEVKRRFGEGIWDLQNEYYSYEKSWEKKAFLRQYPQLKDYWEFRDEYGKIINRRVIELTQYLPEGPGAQFRSDLGSAEFGIGGEDIISGLNQPEDPLRQVTADQWYEQLGAKNMSAIYQYLEDGKSFEYQTKKVITDMAKEFDISLDDLVQYVGLALRQDNQIGQLEEFAP